MNHLNIITENRVGSGLQNLLVIILIAVFIQLIYGGFMAGLKAASSAPTWPSINGSFIPSQINELSPWSSNLINNKLMIHFIHRGIGYLIFIASFLFFIKSNKLKHRDLFKKTSGVFFFLVVIQILLGITALMISTNPSTFVFVGVAHQFTAMLIVMSLVVLLFLAKKRAEL